MSKLFLSLAALCGSLIVSAVDFDSAALAKNVFRRLSQKMSMIRCFRIVPQ